MAAEEVIIGRSAEVAQSAAMLGNRPPWTCAIVGSAGIGKTTVWRAMVSAAASRGWRVLVARATPVSEAIPLSTLVELLDSVPNTAADSLPEANAMALRRVSGRVEGSVEDRRLLVVTLRRLLAQLAKDKPVLIAVDDEQWVDSASAAVLVIVLTGPTAPSVAVVVCRRANEPSRLLRPVDGLPWPRQIELGPLSLEATTRLIYQRFGPGWSRMLVRRVWKRSAGNPFTVLELATAVASHRADPLPEALPLGTLDARLRDRIAELTAEARAAALVTAVLARATVASIKRVAAGAAVTVDVDAALDAGALVQVGSAGEVEFSHPLLAEAVRGWLSPSMRRRLHRAAAELATSPAERAMHLAELAEEPDQALAQSLETALLELGPAGAPEMTIPLAEQAVAITPAHDGAGRFRRRLLLVDMLLAAGDATRARTEIDNLRANATSGRQRAEALWRAHQAGGTDVANDLADLERALSHLGWVGSGTPQIAPEDLPLAAAVMERYLALLGLNSGQLERARYIGREWWSFARGRLDNKSMLTATVSLAQIEILIDPVAARTLLEQCHGTPPEIATSPYGWPRLWIGLQDMWHGAYDQADEVLTGCLRTARHIGDATAEPAVAFHLSELRWRQGRWDEADELVQSSMDALLEYPDDAIAGGYMQALLAASRGDTPTAIAIAQRWGDLAKSFGDTLWVMQNGWAEGHALLVKEDPRAAEVLSSLQQYFSQCVEVGVFPFRPDAVEALLRAGRHEDAEDVMAPIAAAAESIPGHLWAQAMNSRCLGLLASARKRHDSAVELLRQSVAQCRTMQAPYELARSLLAVGGALRRTRHRTASAAALREALDIFTYLGAEAWRIRTRTELADAPDAQDARALTPTETRIATLAAQGNTNAEIAQQLLISIKTVEANLTRVYAKLGVRSRAQLSAGLSEDRAHPQP